MLMRYILEAEFKYNKKLIVGVEAFVPLVCFYELFVSGTLEGYVLITMYTISVF